MEIIARSGYVELARRKFEREGSRAAPGKDVMKVPVLDMQTRKLEGFR